MTGKRKCVWCESRDQNVYEKLPDDAFVVLHKKCHEAILKKYRLALEGLDLVGVVVARERAKAHDW